MSPKPQPQTIRLGDQAWEVRPLTLAQLEELEPIVQAGPATGSIAYGLAVIAAGLRRDHAEAIQGLTDLEATATDLRDAARIVLRLGGYLPAGDVALGEAGAALAAASISASSTDGSPQDADTAPPSSPT